MRNPIKQHHFVNHFAIYLVVLVVYILLKSGPSSPHNQIREKNTSSSATENADSIPTSDGAIPPNRKKSYLERLFSGISYYLPVVVLIVVLQTHRVWFWRYFCSASYLRGVWIGLSEYCQGDCDNPQPIDADNMQIEDFVKGNLLLTSMVVEQSISELRILNGTEIYPRTNNVWWASKACVCKWEDEEIVMCYERVKDGTHSDAIETIRVSPIRYNSGIGFMRIAKGIRDFIMFQWHKRSPRVMEGNFGHARNENSNTANLQFGWTYYLKIDDEDLRVFHSLLCQDPRTEGLTQNAEADFEFKKREFFLKLFSDREYLPGDCSHLQKMRRALEIILEDPNKQLRQLELEFPDA